MTAARRPLVIAIAGGSGTGKTTLARAIARRSGLPIALVSQDDYYFDRPRHIPAAVYNFDSPEAFEWPLLAAHLRSLAAGEAVAAPVYVHARSKRDGERRIEPAPLVLLEGIFALYDPAVREAIDLAVYLDLDLATQLERRIARDMASRDCTRDAVLERWESFVLPAQIAHVEPQRELCHLVLEEAAPDLMADRLLALLEPRAA